MSPPCRISHCSLLAILVLVPRLGIAGTKSVVVLASAPTSDSTADDSLRPTSAPPWNPPHPLSSARTWETILRFPGHLITLPIRGLGRLAERWTYSIENGSLIPRIRSQFSGGTDTSFSVSPADLGDRSGLGIRVRAHPSSLGHHVHADLSESFYQYSRVNVGVSRGPADLSYEHEWRPRERFFGVGVDAPDTSSSYAFERDQIRLSLGHSWIRRDEHVPGSRIEAWAGPEVGLLLRGHEAPSFDEQFPALAALEGGRREHFVYGLRAFRDTRSGRPHWRRGWRASFEAARFDQPIRSLAIRNGRAEEPSFTRLTFQGETGVSFRRDPRTLRLAIKLIDQQVSGDPRRLLVSELSTLGGLAGLSGFSPGRFHDLDLAVARLSYVFPLSKTFELDLHAESGSVVPTLRALRRSALEHSYGVAFRPRRLSRPLFSIGLDGSREGARMTIMLTGVE